MSTQTLSSPNPSYFESIFSEAGFMPHGHCYLWKPALVWTHVVSDLLIGLAYIGISLTLYALIKRIKIPFSMVAVYFGVFIGACGLTHFMGIWNLWNADYWLSAWIKVVTAIASVGTSLYLFKLRHSVVTVAEAAKLSEQRRLDLESLTKDLENRVQIRTQEARASHDELLDIINGIPSMIMHVSLDYKYLVVNSTFEEWFGISREKVIGKYAWEVFNQDQFEKLKSYLDLAAQGQKIQFSTEVSYPNGANKYVQITYTPRYVNGKIESVIALVTDKTQDREYQRQVEKFANKSERDRAQLEAVFDAVMDGVVVTDMQGHFLFLNEAQASICGFPNVESMKQSFDFFVQTFELRKPNGDLLAVEQWPLSRILRGETVTNEELYGRRKDTGQEWVFSYSGQPVLDEHGKQFLALVITRDITTQKRNELAQLESLEQFKTLANAIPQMAWMAEPDGQIIWQNEEWYRYTGLDVEHSTGWKWIKLIHPDFHSTVIPKLKSYIRSDQAFEIEFPIKSKSDGYRWFLIRVRPLREKHGPVYRWFGTNTDIEDQKRVHDLLKLAKDQAEAASDAKSRFLANMSHELRTPMTAVLGFTDILRDADLPDQERKDALDRVDRSGRTLLRLIDDVLDISKIEAGKVQIHKSRFSPMEVASEVISLFKLQAERKGVRLKMQFADTVPESACSDSSRIHQILTNLISNAVKFTSKGEIRVFVSAESDLEFNRQYLVFEVEDSGIGISPNDQQKLFQPFAQADESITRKFGGTGLGLVLSKRLAELLGGELYLKKSTPEMGSVFVAKVEGGPFHFYSVATAENLETKAPVLETKSEKCKLEDVRILLVEDVPDNQVLMRKYLELAHANVDLAEDGLQAVSKALKHNYDVVLMDIQLPQMDGIQATKMLRQKGFQKPIIALTAHALPEEVNRSHEAGCNEHLTKPITRIQLVDTVQRWAGL